MTAGREPGRLSNRNWRRDCQLIADGIRARALAHTIVHGGYLSQACSSAEIFALLYGHQMNLGPSGGPLLPRRHEGWKDGTDDHVSGMIYNGGRAPDTDRFFVSPTHYALVVYSALIESGRLAPGALDQFNTDGSTVEMIGGERSPGHEVNGGSFGQAISQAAGVAWARRRAGDAGTVWLFLGDGEIQEGQTWEAVLSMAFLKLENVKVLVDVNGQQVDGRVSEVMDLEPLERKFEAFGWAVATVDGHDLGALHEACATPHPGRPLVVLAYTEPYRGIPLLKDRYPYLHYIRFRSEAERTRYRDVLAAMQLPVTAA